MEQKTDKFYPSAPLMSSDGDLEQRLGKNLNYVISFENSINNIKEMITHFKDKHHKSKKECKKYKTLNTILKLFDTIVIIASTSSSITLSLAGIGLIAIPISSSIACELTISNIWDKYAKK